MYSSQVRDTIVPVKWENDVILFMQSGEQFYYIIMIQD